MCCRCPAWTTVAGEQVTAESTCQSDGTWSNPTHFPPTPLSSPAVLNKPDGPDMMCGGCNPLNLTYNPNDEEGAEFYCNPPIDWARLPVKLDKMVECSLLCDRMVVAVVRCQEESWTGKPELGFWCTEKKSSVHQWKEGDNTHLKEKSGKRDKFDTMLESTEGKESNVRPKSEIVTKPESDRKHEKVGKSKFMFEPGQGHNFTSEIKSRKVHKPKFKLESGNGLKVNSEPKSEKAIRNTSKSNTDKVDNSKSQLESGKGANSISESKSGKEDEDATQLIENHSAFFYNEH